MAAGNGRRAGKSFAFRSKVIESAVSRLLPIVEPAVEDAGYRLVRLRLVAGRRKTLQVMAERPDGTMDVEDCARLSRALSERLAEDDPIAGEWVLEVSSPGIDRPLVRLADFARYAGHEARVELAAARDGRKRFKGEVMGVDGDKVVLRVAGAEGPEDIRLPHKAIAEAKLVLTDRLIAEDLKAKSGRTPRNGS